MSELKLPLKLKWRSEKDMPWATWGCQQAVVFKEKVYIRGGDASSDRETQTVTVYEPTQDTYDTLPQYPYKNFTMGIVNS